MRQKLKHGAHKKSAKSASGSTKARKSSSAKEGKKEVANRSEVRENDDLLALAESVLAGAEQPAEPESAPTFQNGYSDLDFLKES